jgi:hypothetical protein
MGILKYHPTFLISYERGWPLACLEDLIKPNQAPPSGCQVNIKCFYAKSTCIGSNYRNISSLTLVQKVIQGYLQRTVDNYSRAYLWLISHDLSHGVPLMINAYYTDHWRKKRRCTNRVWYFHNNSARLRTRSAELTPGVPKTLLY